KGVLEDPRGQFVAAVGDQSAREHRGLILLSHHQYVSHFDTQDLGHALGEKLGAVLAGGRVSAWFWGHEHRCMTVPRQDDIALPRCIGHGGVPVPGPAKISLPDGVWEQAGYVDEGGQRWGRFGFAVLDVVGDEIQVRYRDDTGAVVRTETITRP